MTLANLKIRLEIENKKDITNSVIIKMLEERIERRTAKYIKMGRIKEEPKPKKEEKKDAKGSA